MKTQRWVVSALALSLGATVGLFTATAHAAPAAAYAAGIQDRPWDQPPDEFRDAERRGFHDGIEGARRDFDNHRPPSPENRDEYRHPHVPRDLRHDYREGFRRGYEVGMHHIMGDRDHHDFDRDHDRDHDDH